jgi:hypothetical protein
MNFQSPGHKTPGGTARRFGGHSRANFTPASGWNFCASWRPILRVGLNSGGTP